MNTNARIENVSFSGGTAIAGGAIYFETTSYDFYMNISNTCSFSNNMARRDGGAIKYTLKRPEVNIGEITTYNNVAEYGSFIASYPIKMDLHMARDKVMMDRRVKEEDFEMQFFEDLIFNFQNGDNSFYSISLTLRDADNQIMVLDSNSRATIVIPTNPSSLSSGDYNRTFSSNGSVSKVTGTITARSQQGRN
jgi:predicted outer membrane repeat protein